MRAMLKKNASHVHSELGIGASDHLGLVLDDAIYQAITGHQYIRLVYPDSLVIETETVHYEAVRL